MASIAASMNATFKVLAGVLLASLFVVGAALLWLMTLSPPKYVRCDRSELMRATIDRNTFAIPLFMVAGVGTAAGEFEIAGLCNRQIEANRISLIVTRNAGDAFYLDWHERRRMPTQISIYRHDGIKNFTADMLRHASDHNTITVRDDHGYRRVETKGQVYFDATPLGLRDARGVGIAFNCMKYEILRMGFSCSTSYRYDDVLDIRYLFTDRPMPRADWIERDRKVREYVRSLIVN